MGWLNRLFDSRDTFVRMLLLDLSGVGYLVFGMPGDGHTPTTLQWILAVLAFASALIFYRHLVLGLLAQTLLLAASFALLDDATISKVGTAWILLELAMWAHRTRTIWLSAALVAAVYALDMIGDPWRTVPSTIFGIATAIGLPVLIGMVIRTTRELSRQAAEKAAEEQMRRESESRAARADERAMIARELHDLVAHHVASMVLRVGVARHVLPDVDPRVAEVFDDVHGTGSAALAELRRLVALLRNPDSVRGDAALTAIEPAALPAALATAVANAERAGVSVDADIDLSVGTLDAARGLAVLRLTQEALTNVAKHAGSAARARLDVAVREGDLHWEVVDDGGGAGPAGRAVPPGGGHGITGMRERVEVLGGSLTAAEISGGGWRVATTLPAGGSRQETAGLAAEPRRPAGVEKGSA